MWHSSWTCKIWKTIYHSLYGRWLLKILHRMIEQHMCKVSTHCKMSNKKEMCYENTSNKRDALCMFYAKATKRQDMNFQDYCRHVHTLNKDQCHIVMYNRAWCKSYINAVRHGEKQEGYKIFLSGPGGQGKVMLYVLYKEICPTFSNTQ